MILSVGAVWDSAYELYAHKAVAAAKVGLPADVVEALASGQPSDGLSDAEVAAQRFTLELARDRKVSDTAYEAVERHLGREALVALVFLAAAYAGTCMLLNAFAVPSPNSEG